MVMSVTCLWTINYGVGVQQQKVVIHLFRLQHPSPMVIHQNDAYINQSKTHVSMGLKYIFKHY